MLSFDDLVNPAVLLPEHQNKYRHHVSGLQAGALQLDAAIATALERPSEDSSRGDLAGAVARGILSDLKALAQVPGGMSDRYIRKWKRETRDRFLELGLPDPFYSDDQAPMHAPECGLVRPLDVRRPDPRSSEHSIIVSYLDDLESRINNLYLSSWALDGLFEEEVHVCKDATTIAQQLYNEAVLRLEIERVDQRLDHRTLIPWSPLRDVANTRDTIALAGVDLTLNATSFTQPYMWNSLSAFARIWFVNNLVLDVVVTAPDQVDDLKTRDVNLAIEGNVAAWDRLRAACLRDAAIDDDRSSHAGRPSAQESINIKFLVGPDWPLWATTKPVLDMEEHGEAARLEVDHRHEQHGLKDAIHHVWDVLARIQECERPRQTQGGTVVVHVPRGAVQPVGVAEAQAILREVQIHLDKSATYRRLIAHWVSPPNQSVEDEQNKWVEREIGPLREWVSRQSGECTEPARAPADTHLKSNGIVNRESVAPSSSHDSKLAPMVPNWPTEYPLAYRKLFARPDDQNPEGLGRRPRQDEVARQLGITLSTFKRYRDRTRDSWPPI